MKRMIVSLMVVAGALLSACTEEDDLRQTAGLEGTYDVALVDQGAEQAPLLFVTSTDNNELRVLSLEREVTERDFIRAPNPLQPLGIPVLPRPQALTRDVRYDANGVEQSGRLVFARSSGSTEISVVAAGRDELREVRRLRTPQLTGTSVGPVTAFAAQASEQPGGQTRLFFATQETDGAKLWEALLPTQARMLEEAGAAEEARTPVEATEVPGLALTNVAVNSLLVLPSPAGHPGVLAVSTRGTTGAVYRVDLDTKTSRPLNFGGSQVLQLATHGRVEYDVVVQTEPGVRKREPRVRKEGSRIFGILDPSNCGVVLPCTGVLAVDTDTGEVAKDRTAYDAQGNLVDTYPMMPITSGIGLPTGLSLATTRNLQVQSGEPLDRISLDAKAANDPRDLTLPVLGIVPLSNGAILFFDALNMIHLNVEAIWGTGQTVNTATASSSLISASGTSLDDNTNDEVQFTGTFGVTRDQTYVLTYQALLPDMSAVAREQGTGAFKVPYVPRAGKEPAPQLGDIITLLPDSTGTQPCATPVTVLEVQVPAEGETLATLVPSGNLPAACANYSHFQVRAAGLEPLVISSAGEDYLGRVGPGGEFSRTGSYFFHPPGYEGQAENVAVRLNIIRQNLETGDPGRGIIALARGDSYVVATDAHFFPYLISVDTAAVTGDLFSFRLPGSVVQATVANQDYAYIAYPSANGVLEVDLTNITAGIANSRGLFPYL